MFYPNPNQHGTQIKDQIDMVSKSFLDKAGIWWNPSNVGCSNFRCTKNDQRNHSTQRRQRKIRTKEDNKNVLHCYFNLAQRRYKTIEIWAESARFNTKSQRLADQVRLILMKGWFSELEILKICVNVNIEECEREPSPRIEARIEILKSKSSLTELKYKILKTKTQMTPAPQNQC